MSNPIRILHVLNGLGTGGAEAMIMNWYRRIDRDKVQFDFLVRSNESVYTEEIARLGGRVFVMPAYPARYFENKRETKCFFKEHSKEYAGIHVHGNALLYVNVFGIAKRNGIKLRVFHSHSTFTSRKYFLFHVFNRFRIKRLATDFFACSKAAGKWAFNSCEYTVVNNGIDLGNFSYNENRRSFIRKSLGISNEVVYGHVGRFVPVKNHGFLLDVFEDILKNNKKALLLLVGEGELFDEVKKRSQLKKIDDRVLFVGKQSEVYDYLNAMDVFIFPSYHEGLGVAAIEAQATGLPCLLSDSITKEVQVTDLVRFLPISERAAWVKSSLEVCNIPRADTREQIRNAGYDVEHSTKILQEFYCAASARKE